MVAKCRIFAFCMTKYFENEYGMSLAKKDFRRNCKLKVFTVLLLTTSAQTSKLLVTVKSSSLIETCPTMSFLE